MIFLAERLLQLAQLGDQFVFVELVLGLGSREQFTEAIQAAVDLFDGRFRAWRRCNPDGPSVR